MQWTEFSHHVRHLSVRDRTRVKDAFELGTQVHEGQLRKSGEPFFSHPIAVAEILTHWGADADTIIAALLHDSVEDTPLTVEDVDKKFGPKVATLIEGVTKLSSEEFAHRPTLDEATETLRKMFRLMESDVRIIVIKLADRLHNMMTIEFLKPDRRQAIARETLDIYVKVAEQLSMQELRLQLEELSLKTLDTELYEKLAALRENDELQGETVIKTMRKMLDTSQFSSPSINLEYEHMSWPMLREKYNTNGMQVTGIPSLIVAIVCKSIPDCYYMMGTLHQIWQRETLSFQDYINSPLLNGYRGLHTTIILEDGRRVACKIRIEEMHQYARQGITLFCFGGKTHGMEHFIPWAERISPLIEDTKNQSSEFWQGLQSDILGKSIMIHGPEAKSMMLPKGATALDGAFYFFREEALKLTSIEINGQTVSPQTGLKIGDSIDVTIGEMPTAQREWLLYVRTGLSTAFIRTGLSLASPEEKLLIGKEMLQQVMLQRGKGLIQEFEEAQLAARAKEKGYDCLQDVFASVADGHLPAVDAYGILFAPPRVSNRQKRQTMTLGYTPNMTDEQLMNRIDAVTRKHADAISEINYSRKNGNQQGFLKVYMSPDQAHEMMDELRKAGAAGLKLFSIGSKSWTVIAVSFLVALWGIDPLVAHELLIDDIAPFALTIGRFFTCFLAAALIHGLQAATSKEKLKPLNPLKQRSLLLAGISLVATAMLTYLTLDYLPASQYILFILAGQLFSSLLKNYAQRQAAWRTFLSFFFAVGTIIALLQLQQSSPIGILYALGASFSFALYSQISESYQRSMINSRYPAYLFWVSLIALLGSVLLLPIVTIPEITVVSATKIVTFSLLFTFLPYILYFEITRRVGRELLDHALPLIFAVTFVGEMLVNKSYSVPLIVALGLLLLPMVQTFRQR